MTAVSRLTRLLHRQFSTPGGAPAAGTNYEYAKSDGNLYQMAPDGVERLLDDSHPVRVVAVGSLSSLSGPQTIDGVACVAGDRVLCISQGVFAGNNYDNGVWQVNAGAWTRAGDAATTAQMVGLRLRPTEGRYAGQVFVSTMAATNVLGTNSLSFELLGATISGSVFEQPWMNKAGQMFIDVVGRSIKYHDGSNVVYADPPGVVSEYAGFTAPTGYLLCDGTAYSRSTYLNLWNAITTAAFTATGASGQKVVATATASLAYLGMVLDAPGIAAGNKITAVTPGVSYTLTSNITTTLTGTNNARITPWGNGDGTTTFNVPDRRGVTGVGVDGTTEFANMNTKFGEKTHVLTLGELATHGHALAQAMHLSNAEAAGFGLAASSSFTNRVVVGGAPANTEPATAGSNTPHNNIQPSVAVNYIVKT